MANDTLSGSLLKGSLEFGRQSQIRGLQQQIAEAQAQGVDLTQSPLLGQLAGFNAPAAQEALGIFGNLGVAREKKLFEAANVANIQLQQGNIAGLQSGLEQRVQAITLAGGNASDTQEVLDDVLSGNLEAAGIKLANAVQVGQEQGFLAAPEARKGVIVGEGQQLRDPVTGKLIAQGRIKPTDDDDEKLTEVERGRIINDTEAALNNIDLLFKDDSFEQIFGSIQGVLPDLTASARDSAARKDQLVSLLALDSRQKLKGQGTISDSEAAQLEKSATVLANDTISDKEARRELNRVQKIF